MTFQHLFGVTIELCVQWCNRNRFNQRFNGCSQQTILVNFCTSFAATRLRTKTPFFSR